MKIFLAGNFDFFGDEDAWVRALTELGHDVRAFRVAERFSTPAQRLQFRLRSGPAVDSVNRLLLSEVEAFRPDIVLVYRVYILYASTLERLRERACSWVGHRRPLLVCYNNDNPFGPKATWRRWRHFRRAIPLYDLHLVFRTSNIAQYRSAGASRVILVRHHYVPWLHRKVELSPDQISKWESDIIFVGHWEKDPRIKQIPTLMQAVPAKYCVRGPAWHRHLTGPLKGMDTSPIGGEDYVAALNAAKIALSFISKFRAIDTYTTRSFEIPACGTMMLSQRTADLLTMFEEDKEAVYFDSTEELIEKARYYLAHDRERQAIADAGHRRCLSSGYDIYSRMREWLTVAEEMLSEGKIAS